MNRRSFIKITAAGAAATAFVPSASGAPKRNLRKAIMYSTIGVKGSVLEKWAGRRTAASMIMRPQWLLLLLLAALLVGAARPPWRFTKDDVSAILRLVGREKERNWRLVSIDPGKVEGTATVRLRESVRGKDAISRIPKERILTLKKTKKGWTIESKKEVTPEAKEALLNKPGGKSCTLRTNSGVSGALLVIGQLFIRRRFSVRCHVLRASRFNAAHPR